MTRVLAGFLIVLAMGCQSSAGGGGEAKAAPAQRSALELSWPRLTPTGFRPVKLEPRNDRFEPVQPMPREGAARVAQVTLPATAGLPFEVRDGAMALKVRLLGQQPTAGVMRDDTVLFAGGYRGADVTLRAVAGGVEDFLSLDGTLPPSVEYDVELEGVAGVRLVADTLEFLTPDGDPKLRMAPPTVLSKHGSVPVRVSVAGCAFDSSPRGPWGRRVTPPAAQHCTVRLQWELDASGYPALLDPAWITTGDMGVARFSHSMVQVPSVNLNLVCGGSDVTLAPLSSCELFNHVTGTWAATGSMPRQRSSFAMAYAAPAAPGPRVAAVGGDGPAVALAAVDLYNPALGTWVFGANMPFGRSYLTATTLPNDQNVIVIVGGQFDGGGCADRTENIILYRFSLNTAVLVNNLAAKRALHNATVITTGPAAGSILITGGVGTCCGGCTGGATTAELISATGFAVAPAGTMVRPGRLLAASYALPSGQVRLAGGLIDTGTNQTWADSELFTPPATWNDFRVFPAGLQAGGWGAFGVTQDGGLLIAAGGDSAVANQSTARTFVFNGTAWVADGALVAARRGLSQGMSMGGQVMAVGGADTSPFVVFRRTELFELLPNGAPCAGNGLCQSQQCIDGVCCNSSCAGNCDACNLTGTLGACTPQPSTVVCRPATAAGCDLAENCTGSTATCPGDGFAPNTTTCRASTGACDPAENCVGGTPTCPADVLSPNSTICRADAGACDIAERCTGTTAVCPTDTFLSGVACRTSAGVCDVVESCDGTAAGCPADAFNSGLSCRAASGLCDVAEVCSGLMASCPTDAVASAATTCRAAAGTCDVVELCSGASTSCGADVLFPQGTVCNLASVCSGTDAGCPSMCTFDSQCAPGAKCINGMCVIQVTPGNPCTQAAQCTTGFCVDGVCCNSACTGSCATCNLAGSVGTCAAVAVGNAGDPTCSPYLCDGASQTCPGSCVNNTQCAAGFTCLGGSCLAVRPNAAACTADTQCSSGFCVDGVCCNSACTGSCATCNLAGSVGTCAAVALGNPGDPTCSPYLCDGASQTCPGSCVNNTQCVAGFACIGGSCLAVRPNAAACTADTQCSSGFCTDGVCCNARCEGGCEACNVAGAVGTCSIAGRGDPGTPVCAPFVCDGASGQCPATCAADADCGPPAFCENKVCSSRTRGHVGFGCAGCTTVDGASLLLGALLLLLRRARGGGR